MIIIIIQQSRSIAEYFIYADWKCLSSTTMGFVPQEITEVLYGCWAYLEAPFCNVLPPLPVVYSCIDNEEQLKVSLLLHLQYIKIKELCFQELHSPSPNTKRKARPEQSAPGDRIWTSFISHN